MCKEKKDFLYIMIQIDNYKLSQFIEKICLDVFHRAQFFKLCIKKPICTLSENVQNSSSIWFY